MPTSAREKLQISDTSDCIGKVLKSPTKKRPRFSGGAFYDRVCKPGSVIDSHLSRRTVAGALQPPSRKQPGKPCFLCGVAPDRVYSNGRFHTPLGELLPRLSILTSSAQTSYPSPRRKRQVSAIPLRRLRQGWKGAVRAHPMACESVHCCKLYPEQHRRGGKACPAASEKVAGAHRQRCA